MTFHRAESHALFWLTLFSPLAAWVTARLSRPAGSFRHWCLAIWLILITHTLLDAMTVYGTQLLLPFSDYPFGVASIFIIDPLYTVPLLVGLVCALRWRGQRGSHANRLGLVVSTLYLCWTALAQQYVSRVAEHSLAAADVAADRYLVTPTPFNTLIWRVLVITPDGYAEGFYSLLDGGRPIRFDHFPRNMQLHAELAEQWHTARMVWFSHGFFAMAEEKGRVRITDLRMGQEPDYVFSFVVAEREAGQLNSVLPQAHPTRRDIGAGLRWLQQRLLDAETPPLHRQDRLAAEP